jgi:CYTH domain-containing protein
MPITRRFLLSASLGRLIRKECGTELVTEGHFPTHSDRHSHVRVENGHSYLVLTSPGDGAEDSTELPGAHAQALLDVCRGKVVFERSRLPLNGKQTSIERFTTPGLLDLVRVEFASQTEADAFTPPVWFGDEVTEDESHSNRTIAMSGLPPAAEAAVSDAALHALLDVIEGRAVNEALNQSDRAANGATEPRKIFEMPRAFARVENTPGEQPSRTEEASPETTGPAVRRPVLQARPERSEPGDERLSGLISGLSEALLIKSR